MTCSLVLQDDLCRSYATFCIQAWSPYSTNLASLILQSTPTIQGLSFALIMSRALTVGGWVYHPHRNVLSNTHSNAYDTGKRAGFLSSRDPESDSCELGYVYGFDCGVLEAPLSGESLRP